MGEMEESGSLRCAEAVLGLENPPLARRGDIRVKVAANTETKHNPTEEPCWVSCLRENFTSSSYGEELETGPAASSGTAPVPYPTDILCACQVRPRFGSDGLAERSRRGCLHSERFGGEGGCRRSRALAGLRLDL